MGKKSKVIDLVVGEDGQYEAVRKPDKVQDSKSHSKGRGLIKTPIGDKPKYVRENHADEFLSGLDTGLDLIEKFVPRLERFLRLRG
jgi:hypothetical protein